MLYLLLLGPTILLGCGFVFDGQKFGWKISWLWQIVPLILLVGYCVWLFSIGSDQALQMFHDQGGGFRSGIRGDTTFILPGLAFAAVIFPDQLYKIGPDPAKIAWLGLKGLYRFAGVVALFFIFIRQYLFSL
ncbi:hypothetical protein [Pelagibaculum spongiae]|uniref:hypothetical protein n=1 Tax=Pelagibaculum spongiae TaxID=2080658 RepID=UPI001057AA8D|nr:hypothetical protein [Pelagibaculum spongiae]